MKSTRKAYGEYLVELGKKDKAYEIRRAKPKIEKTSYYDEENLTQTILKSITKI